MAITNSLTETNIRFKPEKNKTMAPTRRVTQTTNATPRENKNSNTNVFKLTENKKICNKIDSNIIKFGNFVYACDIDGTVTCSDHVMFLLSTSSVSSNNNYWCRFEFL